MFVIIPHSTEELKLINFQKQLIAEFFQEDRIIYPTFPLWIELSEKTASYNKNELKNMSKEIQAVKLGDLTTDFKSIFIPVQIKNQNEDFISELTLVRIHRGQTFTTSDKSHLSEIKQPVNQLKIFRLGIEQAEGPYSKSISNSVWVKLNS